VTDLDRLAATLGELARSLHQEVGVEDTLDGIVSAAVSAVPGAQEAELSVIEDRRGMRTQAPAVHRPAALVLTLRIRDDIHEAFLSLACAIVCYRRLTT
jgi:hypothetical protein